MCWDGGSGLCRGHCTEQRGLRAAQSACVPEEFLFSPHAGPAVFLCRILACSRVPSAGVLWDVALLALVLGAGG